ncbi:MAG: hypothetical protein J6P07_04785 [Spirochaetaceae bacterium]|nr:hypothetical protein [Spirochaetaceae bacterium]MBO7731551.1 hypothetical protein [Methanobrevibacter sp.]
MNFIPIEEGETKQREDGTFYKERTQCPFNVRDLKNDECYSGNGKNRCRWFIRYDWDKHYGCIVCSHPLMTQQEFDFGE